MGAAQPLRDDTATIPILAQLLFKQLTPHNVTQHPLLLEQGLKVVTNADDAILPSGPPTRRLLVVSYVRVYEKQASQHSKSARASVRYW